MADLTTHDLRTRPGTPSRAGLLHSAALVVALALATGCGGGSREAASDRNNAARDNAARDNAARDDPAQEAAAAPDAAGGGGLNRGPGERGPLAISDPLSWLDSEQRSPAAEVAAIAARVEAEEEPGAAVTALDAWLAEHPDDVDALYWRGRAKLLLAVPEPGTDPAVARETLDAAVADLEAAVAGDPGFQGARQFLSDAYVRTDRHADALAQLDALVEARPEVGILYANRAFLRRKGGDGPGSARDIIKACDLGHVRACVGARLEKQRLEAWEAKQEGTEAGLDATSNGADAVHGGGVAAPVAPATP